MIIKNNRSMIAHHYNLEEEFEAVSDVHINCIDETQTTSTINILYILHTVYILNSKATPALAHNSCRVKYI